MSVFGIFPGHVLYEKLRKQNFTAINYHRDQLKCTPILNPVEFMIPSFPNLSLACVNFWPEQKYLFNLNIKVRVQGSAAQEIPSCAKLPGHTGKG